MEEGEKGGHRRWKSGKDGSNASEVCLKANSSCKHMSAASKSHTSQSKNIKTQYDTDRKLLF